MQRRISHVWLVVVALFLVFIPVSWGADKFFPIEKVRSGMNGEALTVFQGTRVEKFNVKVISVLKGNFGEEPLILVRLSGKPIEQCGGLVAGMSGSPVYIRGALLGAISYGFENADPFLAYVTPVKGMLKLFETPAQTKRVGRLNYQHSNLVMTPVIVSGVGTRGFSLISRLFERNGLKAIDYPVTESNSDWNGKDDGILTPGSAIAVQLVAGDYRAAAIGTVTWTDGNRFLAFGHPFTNKGDVDLFVYKARIDQIVKSPALGMKLGSALYPVGRIFTDRHCGIAGQIGVYPQTIAVGINVKDSDRDLEYHHHFQVINDERFYPELLTTIATSAIDQAIDRVGAGTAKVMFSLTSQGEVKPFVRDNLFYSKDIAVSCFKELGNMVSAYAVNEFSHIELRTVQVDVEISSTNTTTRILKLESEKIKVKPGETMNLQVTLHPFRGKDFAETFPFQVPTDIQPGKLLLTVSGGAVKADEKEKTNPETKSFQGDPDKSTVHSVDELLNQLASNYKNNDLVLEYTLPSSTNASEGNKKERVGKSAGVKTAANCFISGKANLEIEVSKE